MIQTILILEILKLESLISSKVFEDNKNTVHFDYLKTEILNFLTVYTYNPKKDESFVLIQTNGNSKLECLQKVIDYLNTIKSSPCSFTVSWVKKGEGMPTQNSYFYCEDVYEVIEKFYKNKVRQEYTVFSIVQNPIS